MSDPSHDPAPAAEEAPVAAPAAEEAPVAAPASRRSLMPILAGALIALAALVATAPFWAGSLPWGPAARNGGKAALAAHLDRLAAAGRQQAAATTAALQHLDQKIAALAARPAATPLGLGEINSRLDKLAGAATDLAQRTAAQSAAIADLAQRVAALDKEVRSRAATGASDTMLALTLVEIRDAVAAGRPFAAEYARLAALVRARPEIATVAAALAGPAKTGVASRAALAERLRALASKIATPPPQPEAAGGWAGAALRRLGGLVRIRRIGAPAPAGPKGALAAAQRALAGGDLEGAVADVARLESAAGEAVRPWLRAARERLAVEATLHRLASLIASLPAGAGSPG